MHLDLLTPKTLAAQLVHWPGCKCCSLAGVQLKEQEHERYALLLSIYKALRKCSENVACMHIEEEACMLHMHLSMHSCEQCCVVLLRTLD